MIGHAQLTRGEEGQPQQLSSKPHSSHFPVRATSKSSSFQYIFLMSSTMPILLKWRHTFIRYTAPLIQLKITSRSNLKYSRFTSWWWPLFYTILILLVYRIETRWKTLEQSSLQFSGKPILYKSFWKSDIYFFNFLF